MPSTTGHYDQDLLAAAPAATKAQLQEGYTTDLLNPDHGKATPPASASQADPELGHVQKESTSHVPTTRTLPFWRTKKGMIIIAAVASAIIVGAVIGGAVGGTAHRRKKDTSEAGQGQSQGSVSTESIVVGGTGTEPPPTATISQSTASDPNAPTAISLPFPAIMTSATPGPGQGQGQGTNANQNPGAEDSISGLEKSNVLAGLSS
ncbi:hypothetical protein D9615_007193 [Tricholomella constricta]|uniref:Uncharacterized protein n=1 Tax=Tricholomella constricta TaxID=117010 RepID=A0A8H5H8F0_9AGAR|nr:hypothetical protein D9615_007193 [Tricholomella constricta]